LSLIAMDRKRGAPVTPEVFSARIMDKTFTNGADRDTIVIPKYAKTFHEVIDSADTLKFVGLGFGDEEAHKIMAVARKYCKKSLTNLDLSFNMKISIPLEEWAALAHESEVLEKLQLGAHLGVNGVADLASLQKLGDVNLYRSPISGDLSCLAPISSLTTLVLGGTRVTGNVHELVSLTRLVALDLFDTQVTGDVAGLSPLTRLRCLILTSTQVSGDVFELSSLTELTALALNGTQVAGDKEALRKALPKCKDMYF